MGPPSRFRPGDLDIVEDDLSGDAVRALVAFHLDDMHRHSPADSVHALPVDGLRAPHVTFWSAWSDSELSGFAALRELAPDHGEIKSMRAAPSFRNRGVGRILLDHLIGVARVRGYRRLSLETGRTAPFHAAQALYRRNGFRECPPFADYADNDFSMCMTRTI
ncbi:MAG: GNAT family N-acetyltransferase [Pseudomonadota bacterium]